MVTRKGRSGIETGHVQKCGRPKKTWKRFVTDEMKVRGGRLVMKQSRIACRSRDEPSRSSAFSDCRINTSSRAPVKSCGGFLGAREALDPHLKSARHIQILSCRCQRGRSDIHFGEGKFDASWYPKQWLAATPATLEFALRCIAW